MATNFVSNETSAAAITDIFAVAANKSVQDAMLTQRLRIEEEQKAIERQIRDHNQKQASFARIDTGHVQDMMFSNATNDFQSSITRSSGHRSYIDSSVAKLGPPTTKVRMPDGSTFDTLARKSLAICSS